MSLVFGGHGGETPGNQEETHSNKGGLAFLTSAPHFVTEVTDLL
jgi:hypothetical protein